MVPRLKLSNITKRYPGVVANDDVSMSIMPGEIHAVLGENGAGKSTLMKMIYGATRPDSGQIECDGNVIGEHSPSQARQIGIEMVYQHFALFESATVVENIVLSTEKGFDLNDLAKRIEELSHRYGMPIDPYRYVHELSVGERQRVELVRCLLQSPKLLILDEPTSVLTPQAVQRLFETLRVLAAEGCSILYISHKLDEVQELCDTATILRGGKVVGTTNPKECTTSELARMMVGAEIPKIEIPRTTLSAEPVFSVKNLSAPALTPHGVPLKDINLDVYGGEIVGIAGVSGNGQAELITLLSGEVPCSKPESIQLHGKNVGNLRANERRCHGLAFVPEERLARGSVPGHSLWENSVLTADKLGLVKKGFINQPKSHELAQSIIAKFKVKATGPEATAESLSGGNLQKFIIGRETALSPSFFLVAQPTWGVDIGAATFIRQTLIDLSRSGTAILVISEELDELFEICDKLLVICNGEIHGPIETASTDREEIGLLMTNGRRSNVSKEAESAV